MWPNDNWTVRQPIFRRLFDLLSPSRLFSVHGNWGSWNMWSFCSVKCGPGKRERMRKCDNPPPKYGGESCMGSDRQTMPCSLSDCPGEWNWSLRKLPQLSPLHGCVYIVTYFGESWNFFSWCLRFLQRIYFLRAKCSVVAFAEYGSLNLLIATKTCASNQGF